MIKKTVLIILLGFIMLIVLAYFRYVFNKPYNLLADSKSEIIESISNLNDKQLLIVVLGANWCPECRKLAADIESEPLTYLDGTALSFVKVDVNGWDRNMDIVKMLGHPSDGGIPAIVVIDNQSRVLTIRTGKQLSQAKSSRGSYYNYFSWLSDAYLQNEYDFDSDSRVFTIDFNVN